MAPRHPPAGSRRRRRWLVLALLLAITLLAVVLVWFQPQVLLYDTVVEDDFPTAATNPDGDGSGAEVTPDDTSDVDVRRGDEPGEDDVVEAPAATDGVTDDQATGPDPRNDEAGSASPSDAGAGGASPSDARATDPEPTGAEGPADPGAAPASEEPRALLTGSFESRNRYTVTGGATAYELPDATRTLRLEGFESTNGPDLFAYLTVGDATEPSDAALAAEYVDLGILRGNVGNQNYTIPADVDLTRFDTVVIWCRRFATAFGAADLR